MTFEQPRELNRYLATPGAWSWPLAWTILKLSAPPFSLALALVLETRYLQGQTLLPGVFLVLALACITPATACFFVRWELRRDRAMEIVDEGVRVRSFSWQKIPWREVEQFIVEPAGPVNEFKKVTLRARPRGQGKPSRWAMIFADRKRYELLISELKLQQAMRNEKFTVEILREPISYPKNPSIRTMPMWLATLGLFLFMHGAAIVESTFVPAKPKPKTESHWEPPRPLLGIFKAIARQFHTFEEYRHAALRTGFALMGAGVVCFVPQFMTLWKKPDPVVGDERILPPPANAMDTV